MRHYNEIFVSPFSLDTYSSYVWDKNGHMTFTCLTNNEYLLQKLVDKINGNSKECFPATLHDSVIYIEGKKALLMRGWGRLTGTGGLNLPSKEAAKIQDDFCEWVVKTLRENEEGIDQFTE